MTREKRSINPELWQACAGPLVNLPAAGTHVVYFPQGHSEQVAASMKKDADAQIPSYPNLSSKLLCLLHNVTLHADPETDEVYAQMTLQPVPSFDKEDLLRSELSLKVNKPHTEFFCKTLTASDTSTHGGFSVPRRAAEKIFPTLDFSMQPPAQELTARDLHDSLWTFRHVYRGQPKRHLLTTGWSHFISGKRLLAGDSVLFIRDGKRDLLLGLRRANRQPPSLSISMLSSNSMHIGILAAAAHAAANNSPFTVFYNPRASPSEFVIPLAKYYRAAYSQQISLGIRFRMQFETEESDTRRHMGTVIGISDLDPIRWKNSQWRNLQVGWDESTGGERRNRVSAWEIEPVISPFFICPPYFGAKHPRQPDNPSEFGNLMKRSMPWFGDDIYMKDSKAYNGFSLAQQMNMGQNQPLANSIHTNLVNPSPGFGADISQQLGFVAPQITQHNNLQLNVPRQMQPLQQPHQLQTSSVPAHALSSDASQIRHNIVNQTLTPPQAHSQIPQTPATAQMQNTLQNTSPLQNIQLQRSIVNQNSIQQQPVFDARWHRNNMVASNPPKQCNPLSQVTSNQAQFELLQKFELHQQSLLPQQSSFQQPSQSTQVQDLQKPNISQRFCSSVVPTQSQQMPKIQNQQPRLMMSDVVQDHVGIASNSITNHPSIIEEYNTPNVAVNQSNNVCDFMAPSSAVALNGKGVETMVTNANPVKDFHQRSSIKPLVDASKPPNQEEFFGQQSNYHSVQGSHLDYLDTCSAASVKEASNISSGGLITNYENCNDGQQELSSSMVTHSFGVPDLAFNSIDSDTQFLNQGSWVPPPQQYQPRMRTYTKVYKRGAVGRSIDVTRYSGYDELKQDLARRFGIVGQLEDRGRVGWKLVYVDHENDVLLVGDDPWEEFIRCVRCIKILSTQEVQQMSLDGEQSNLALSNQACSSSDGGNM
ncbi:hypothetical protein V2J09_019382 [Rumex salicifolius]